MITFQPATRRSKHWKRIASHPDAQWYLGEAPRTALWFILLNKELLGVGGAQGNATSPEWWETELYLLPEHRKKHNVPDIIKAGSLHLFSHGAGGLIAAVETARRERIYKSLGWQKYCQNGDVSYYSLTREDFMRGQPI